MPVAMKQPTQMLHIKLQHDIKEQVDREAAKLGVSRADIHRLALQQFLTQSRDDQKHPQRG